MNLRIYLSYVCIDYMLITICDTFTGVILRMIVKELLVQSGERRSRLGHLRRPSLPLV